METRTYLGALRRYLPVAALLLAAGILGSYLYVRVSMPKTAQATVAVLDPLSARPGSYLAAQVTFDAVITSHLLAATVGQRLDEPADAIQAKLSASVLAPAAGFNLSPLYAVQGKSADTASAIRLVDVAVTEGRKLYLELNRSDNEEIARALAQEREQARAAYADAAAALKAFALSQDAADLPAEIASLAQTLTTLQASLTQAKADLASAQATGTSVATAIVERRVESYERQIETATTELERLRRLQPRYQELTAEVDVARAGLNQLSDAQNSLELGQLVPLPSQVKVLDSARARSNFFMQFLIYTLGILLGLLAAATAIYLLALYRRPPPSAEEIADGFSAPVMAWIPRDTVRRI
jgi:phosphotransferase system HPr-like phosphotransfer protein